MYAHRNPCFGKDFFLIIFVTQNLIMSKLLAPNGKPSNLTAEQYKLVRTPAFKKWFGDWQNDPKNASKIIDGNGEPLPVYHGTTEDFSVFDGGSFFTDDYMNADGYASGEIVLEVFLNVKKPLIINAKGNKWDNLKSKYGSSTREITGDLDLEKYDGVIFKNINDNWFDDESEFTQNVFFSINPNQIKLADGTNTTFDGGNPDIRFNDGGITLYENALNDGLFEDGGVTNKKVYVSIKLDFSYKKISDDIKDFNKFFYTYNDKNFIELKNQELKGVVGVSKSSWNIADWFIFRDALIVMNYNDFIKLNKVTEIDYNDPYQLMKDDCKIFHRLYDHSEKQEEKYKKSDRKSVYGKIIKNLVLEFNLYKNEFYNTNKELEISKIEYFLNPYETGKFYEWLSDNDIILNSPVDLANSILEFTSLTYEKTGLNYWGSSGINEYTLTLSDILPIVEKGVIKAGQTYKDEQEIILDNKSLKIPKNSQLFFKIVGSQFLEKNNVEKLLNSNSNLLKLIDEYDLKSIYSVNFVSQKDLDKYRSKIDKKREEIFNEKLKLNKDNLFIKKNEIISELLKYFLDENIDIVYSKLDRQYTQKFYKEWEGEDTIYSLWYEIPEVQYILTSYQKIVKNEFHNLMLKPVSDINYYSFFSVIDSCYNNFNLFLEQHKDYISDINYRTDGIRFYVGDLTYEFLDSLRGYSDSEYINASKLSDKYRRLFGSDLFRYYSPNEIKLSYSKGGITQSNINSKKGNINIIAEIWNWFGIKF